MKNKIGERIKIKERLYEVVTPDQNTQEFLVHSAMKGFYITSFKMNFVEQEVIVIGKNRALLAENIIIKIK